MSLMEALRPNPKVNDIAINEGWPPRASIDFSMTLTNGEILDDKVIRLIHFQGHETVSQPFEVSLQLRSNDSNKGKTSLNFDAIIGANATVKIGLPETEQSANQSYPSNRPITYINGIITRFSLAEPGVYQATLAPELFKLTLCNDYRIYHGTIKDVLKMILVSKHNIDVDFSRVQGLANDRQQDWMQAGEDDLSFITRLMQKVFVHYSFIHEEGKHTLILSDQSRYTRLKQRKFNENGAYYYTDDIRELFYTFSKEDSFEADDWILAYQYEQNLTTRGTRNVIAQTQAAWEEDATSKLTIFDNNEHQAGNLNTIHYQSLQYGSSKTEVDTIASAIASQRSTSAFKLSGSTSCSELRPCTQFKLKANREKVESKRHYGDDSSSIRPELDGRELVITSLQYQGDIGGSFQANFEAVSADGSVSPYNAQNTQSGAVYAVVKAYSKSQPDSLGPTINYLYRDSFDWGMHTFESHDAATPSFPCKGVYVKFATDEADEPLRWVKLAEHMQTVPELGVTVLISRSNDGSEIPEISSIIQSKGNKVILPSGATSNTNVGDSFSTSYGDNWSIHFGKLSPTDLDQAVTFVEKEKEKNKYTSVSYSIGGSSSYSSSDNGKSGILSDSISYGSSHSKSYAAEQTSHSEVDRQVGFSQTTYSENESITGTQISKSNTQVSKNESFVGTSSSTSTVGVTDDTSSVGTSNSTRTEGITTSTSTAGIQSSTNATGIQSSAGVTGIASSANTTGIQTSTNLTGISTNVNAVGLSSSMNTVGMDTSMGLTGMSTGTSITGVQTNTSIVGTSTSTNIVGSQTAINVTGSSTNINVTGPGVDVNIGSARVSIKNDPGGTDIIIGSDSMVIKAPGIELQILYGIDITM